MFWQNCGFRTRKHSVNQRNAAFSFLGCCTSQVWLSLLRSCWVELLLTLSESDISPSARLWCQGVQPSCWDVHRDTQEGQMRRNFSCLSLWTDDFRTRLVFSPCGCLTVSPSSDPPFDPTCLWPQSHSPTIDRRQNKWGGRIPAGSPDLTVWANTETGECGRVCAS